MTASLWVKLKGEKMKPNTGMEKKLQGIFLAVGIGLMVLAVVFPTPAWAQDGPAD